jgi:hypothetical protein
MSRGRVCVSGREYSYGFTMYCIPPWCYRVPVWVLVRVVSFDNRLYGFGGCVKPGGHTTLGSQYRGGLGRGRRQGRHGQLHAHRCFSTPPSPSTHSDTHTTAVYRLDGSLCRTQPPPLTSSAWLPHVGVLVEGPSHQHQLPRFQSHPPQAKVSAPPRAKGFCIFQCFFCSVCRSSPACDKCAFLSTEPTSFPDFFDSRFQGNGRVGVAMR